MSVVLFAQYPMVLKLDNEFALLRNFSHSHLALYLASTTFQCEFFSFMFKNEILFYFN